MIYKRQEAIPLLYLALFRLLLQYHIQFNIVDTATLHDAQKHPDEYRDLLVRVAGYSDYFNDMTEQLQNEIIARTENDEM